MTANFLRLVLALLGVAVTLPLASSTPASAAACTNASLTSWCWCPNADWYTLKCRMNLGSGGAIKVTGAIGGTQYACGSSGTSALATGATSTANQTVTFTVVGQNPACSGPSITFSAQSLGAPTTGRCNKCP